jgi:transposase
MLHLSVACKYYLCRDATDMRKGFDSLSGMVTQHMQLDALSGSVYIFMNRRRNQVKLLLWEGDGFSLYYKRLEQGSYELPAVADDTTHCITAQQLQFILQGIQLKSIKMKKRYQRM